MSVKNLLLPGSESKLPSGRLSQKERALQVLANGFHFIFSQNF